MLLRSEPNLTMFQASALPVVLSLWPSPPPLKKSYLAHSVSLSPLSEQTESSPLGLSSSTQEGDITHFGKFVQEVCASQMMNHMCN